MNQSQKDFLAGWAGGIAQVLSGQPFDILKVRMQTATTSNSIPSMVRKMVQEEGWGSFYKGTLMPLLGIGACVSIQFGALESLKRALATPGQKDLSDAKLFLAGAGSGFANSFVSCPVELVRIRLQLQKGTVSVGPAALIREMVQKSGPLAIFKGFGVTTVRESLGYGIYFLTYEAGIRKVLADNPHYASRSDIPSQMVVAFGALSGVTLWTLTFPIDVVKTRIQTDVEGRYKSALHCIRSTYVNEGGLRAFYRGFTPCLLRSMPVNAITFVAFEQAMRILNKY